jgi:ElaB/YqjD/DUF883 family membrane-anchored ribosome-binding protein
MEAKSSSMQRTLDRNIERVGQSAHDAFDLATAAASSVAERLGEHAETLAEKRDELMELPENWLEGARDYVREHPFASLGIALATGYLLSMIMRGK